MSIFPITWIVFSRISPGGFQGFGFPVPAVVHVLVQPGDLDAQRGVDEHRHPGVDAVQFIDQFLGPALGNAAVHQDMDVLAVVRLKPDQVAGAGNAGFSAQVGDGDGGWGHDLNLF